MPRPKTSKAFRSAVKRAFDALAEQLKQEGKTPATEIARELNVSRQVAYQYLKGQVVPNPDRLAMLVRMWDLKLEIGGHSFGKGAFGRATRGSTANSGQTKLDFEEISNGSAEIPLPGTESTLRLGVKGSTLSLSIELKRSA